MQYKCFNCNYIAKDSADLNRHCDLRMAYGRELICPVEPERIPYHPNQRLEAARREIHFMEFTELSLSDCRPPIRLLSLKEHVKPLKCKCGELIMNADELHLHSSH